MSSKRNADSSLPRRDFLKVSAATVGAIGAGGIADSQAEAAPQSGGGKPVQAVSTVARRAYNAEYHDEHLSRVAFPLGGIGAGMICLEGSGALSHFSLRNRPEVFNEPCMFAAIAIKGPQKIARVLQGPVPGWKLFGHAGQRQRRGRDVVRPAAVPQGRLHRAVSLRRRATGRQPGPAGGRADRMEPLRAGRRRLFEPAGGRLGIPFHEPDRGDSRGGLLVQRQEFRGGRREPSCGKGHDRRLHSLGRRRKEGPLGRTGAVGNGERTGRPRQLRLVPRRLVRSLDHGLERRGRGGLLRSPAGQ